MDRTVSTDQHIGNLQKNVLVNMTIIFYITGCDADFAFDRRDIVNLSKPCKEIAQVVLTNIQRNPIQDQLCLPSSVYILTDFVVRMLTVSYLTVYLLISKTFHMALILRANT